MGPRTGMNIRVIGKRKIRSYSGRLYLAKAPHAPLRAVAKCSVIPVANLLLTTSFYCTCKPEVPNQIHPEPPHSVGRLSHEVTGSQPDKCEVMGLLS